MEMKEKPLVSIIIPVYNGTNYMREAIDSALNQTYENCEVIVVNDGSTDNGATEEVALSYGDKITYYRKENGGVATAVNYGIDKMRGEYFAWLSHDDVFYPEKIELQLQAIEQSGDSKAICHGNFDFYDMEKQKRTPVNWLSIYTKEQLERGCFAPVFLAIHGSTVLIHKSHFERVGKYRTDLLATQDSEFLFRVMRNQKSVFVEKPLIMGRLHPEQGQKTMSCHKVEYNKMFVDFCEALSYEEKIEMCGSEANFYYRLYELLVSSEPADTVLEYLKEKTLETYGQELPYPVSVQMGKEFLNKLLPINTKLYLFGAGYYGKSMARKLRDYEIIPEGIIDNDKSKHGTVIENIRCCGIEDIDKAVDRVLVIISVSGDIESIREQLNRHGFNNVLTYQQVDQYLFKILPPCINFGE
jgi:glycosyltransferase involved in cell wall biosynthesis